MRSESHRTYLTATLVGMTAVAWIALWWLEGTAYGHFFHAPAAAAAAHAAHGMARGPLAAASVFVSGWVLMTVAMMLPTTLPLVDLFRRLTRDREDTSLLVALLVAGYLLAWTVFGVVAYATVWGVDRLAAHSAWLQASPWTLGVALLFLAGGFQFSSAKYRCLDKCRTPLMFLTERWRHDRERWRAFRVGVDHGIFCVGCCWALMLLMFAVSTASLAWMLGLGIVMAVEKNVSWGRRIGAPVGVVLILGGVASLAYHLLLSAA